MPLLAAALLVAAALPQGEGLEARFQLLRPDSPEPGRTYPLVLFLHGAGERGRDNQAQLKHFPELWEDPEHRERYPCFLLAPQCQSEGWWSRRGTEEAGPAELEASADLAAAIEVLVQVLREEPVDTDRIYLTGLSMGGYGTWELAARHPEWFAAAAPICGGGDVRDVRRPVGLPLWAWHGADDTLVPPEQSREMVAALEAAQGKPRYTELEGVGHDCWTAAYGGGELLDWLFAQRRSDPERALPGVVALAAEGPPLGESERLVFLGDSITFAGARGRGYVRLIEEALAARPGGAVEVIGAGISGNRVPDLLARLETDVLAEKPTAVFVYIGINDVWHSQQGRGTPPEEFEAGLRELLGRIREGGATVVLATPSVIGERPGGANELDEMLEQYAAISRAVATELGIELCDLRRDFLEALEVLNAKGAEAGVLTGDGVHLNDAGNRLVADRAAAALVRALSRR